MRRRNQRGVFAGGPLECGMMNAECGKNHQQRGELFIPRSALPHRNSAHASALVLRRPVTRSPGFHWPRFLRTSIRSKRFMTLRLAPEVLAARRLECCDINDLLDTVFA